MLAPYHSVAELTFPQTPIALLAGEVTPFWNDTDHGMLLPQVNDSGAIVHRCQNDATYEVMRPTRKVLDLSGGSRLSDFSDDSTQTVDRRRAMDVRLRGHAELICQNTCGEAVSCLPFMRLVCLAGVDQPASRPASRPTSQAGSQHLQGAPNPQTNGYAHPRTPSLYSTPPLASGPLPNAEQTSHMSPHLTIPSTSSSSPQRRSKSSTLDSKLSQLSLVQCQGEDADAFHVRSTYAQLDLIGVKFDGIEDGVERTPTGSGSRVCALERSGAVSL